MKLSQFLQHLSSQRGETIESFRDRNGLPRRLRLKDLWSTEISSFLSLAHQKQKIPIYFFGSLTQSVEEFSLVYLSEKPYAEFLEGKCLTVITTLELAHLVPETCVSIVVNDSPRGAWARSVNAFGHKMEAFPSYRDSTARMHKTAVVGQEVYIDRNVIIEENVVLRGPLYIGPDSKIGPGSIIGNDGFESMVTDGGRLNVAHFGGTWIMNNVEIHSNNTIDKSLDGGFTIIGSGTKTDNLVHIAHAVTIGKNTAIAACAEISGSVEIGNNVWIAPNATITNAVKLGDNCRIGIGAVVLRDVNENETVVGHHRSLGMRYDK